jgi:fluoride exporter
VLREWLAVALGGMIGTLARHALNTVVRNWNPSWLPLATLIVNVVGCLAIGWLFRWTLDRQLTNQWWEVAIRVGILGGLTTFSSFALEVVQAWQERPAIALAIVTAHLALGIVCVLVGMNIAAR